MSARGCSSSNFCQSHPFSVVDDVISVAGPLQTCAGHAAGSKAAFHICFILMIVKLLY